jgi:hypothetical protein
MSSREGDPSLPKHNPARLRLPRYGLTGAAATLLVVLVAWVAVRAAGPGEEDRGAPIMVLPSVPTVPAAAVAPSAFVIPIASASPSASPSPSRSSSPSPSSASPSASRSPSRSPSASRSASKSPSPSPSPSRAVRPAFSAGYSASSNWDRGFIGAVQVTNTAGGARNWTVSVTYSSRARVHLRNVWNAQVSRQGSTLVFTGGPLAPGATATFGFEASKRSRGTPGPIGCTVDGTPCRLS